MADTDEAISRLCEVMAAKYGHDPDFEMALGELVGRVRVAFDRRMRDAEAARLLPLGASVVAERQGCHRVTAYRRARRAKIVARKSPGATNP
jgi:hypothetical protein